MTTEIKKSVKLIAIYARVSTARQEEEGTIETQLSAVREFAKKNGYTIIQEYIDDGWSGDILARPQLDQLRQDVKKKIWEGVLIYDPDRLARRYSYQELVMDELREAGIEVIFVTTPAPKTGEEKILHGVKGLFAEYERAKISERFRLGKLRKVKEGHVINSEAPYGYTRIKKSENRQGYYVINEEETRIIKKIFSWIANDGLTIRKVVKELQELGIKPRKSKRGVWATSTLCNILRNTTYIGQAYYGKRQAIVPKNPLKTEKYRKMRKTSSRIRPKEEWIRIPVPAIIDNGLFMRAQQRMKENFELSNRNKKNDYLLAGRIWCECGNRRAGEGPQHGKHLYYRCNSRVLSFPLPTSCNEKGIKARMADELVWQQMVKLMSSPELMMQQIKKWMDGRQKKQHSSIGDTDSLHRELAKLRDEGDRYNKAYGAGLISIEKLREYSDSVRERIALMENQIAIANADNEQINAANLPRPNEIKEFAGVVIKTLPGLNFEEKRAIIRDTIEKVVGTQQLLQVSGQIPVINPNHVAFCSISRNCRIAKRGQIDSIQSPHKN